MIYLLDTDTLVFMLRGFRSNALRLHASRPAELPPRAQNSETCSTASEAPLVLH